MGEVVIGVLERKYHAVRGTAELDQLPQMGSRQLYNDTGDGHATRTGSAETCPEVVLRIEGYRACIAESAAVRECERRPDYATSAQFGPLKNREIWRVRYVRDPKRLLADSLLCGRILW